MAKWSHIALGLESITSLVNNTTTVKQPGRCPGIGKGKLKKYLLNSYLGWPLEIVSLATVPWWIAFHCIIIGLSLCTCFSSKAVLPPEVGGRWCQSSTCEVNWAGHSSVSRRDFSGRRSHPRDNHQGGHEEALLLLSDEDLPRESNSSLLFWALRDLFILRSPTAVGKVATWPSPIHTCSMVGQPNTQSANLSELTQ